MDLSKMRVIPFNETELCVLFSVCSSVSYVNFPIKWPLISISRSAGDGSMSTHTHTHTAAAHVLFFQLTAYRSASCYITIAFFTMLFTPLAGKKIAPLWILHHCAACGAFHVRPDEFPEINISKVAQQFHSILICKLLRTALNNNRKFKQASVLSAPAHWHV